MPSVVLPAHHEPDPTLVTASSSAHGPYPDLTLPTHTALGFSPFLLQQSSPSSGSGAVGKWQLVFWSYSLRWPFWAAVNATPGCAGWGGSQRGQQAGTWGKMLWASAFEAWFPPQTPFPALTEMASCAESQIKYHSVKERILSFPSGMTLPSIMRRGKMPEVRMGTHEMGSGLGWGQLEQPGEGLCHFGPKSHVSTNKVGKSWPACVVKLSSSDSSRWGPHGAQSAANEPNPLILCLQ